MVYCEHARRPPVEGESSGVAGLAGSVEKGSAVHSDVGQRMGGSDLVEASLRLKFSWKSKKGNIKLTN